MLNYVTSRFEEFSSEIKQTANMPSIDEIIRPSISNLTSADKVTNESAQAIASKQSVDMKRFGKKAKKFELFFTRKDHHQHFQRKYFECVHRF